MPTSRPSLLIVVVSGVSSVVVFVAVVLVTGFVACGLSGCSGAGFGASFSPALAQVGLVSAGVVMVPFALVVLAGRLSLRGLAVGGAVGLCGGSVLAMVVLGLGPNGCPVGQSRATVSSEAFSPGSSTCSGDPDALEAPGPT